MSNDKWRMAMIVDRLDVAAVRLCERRGMFPGEADLAEVELSLDDYQARLRRLSTSGVVRSFKAVLVVPPLLGGDWVLAGVMASVSRPLGVANALARKLPFVTEIVLNLGLPERLGPNLSLLFYSRDFDTEAQFIRTASGLEYQEVFRVADYSFPMVLPLSSEERALVKHLVEFPESDTESLAAALGRGPDWVRAKLDRLLWTEGNRSGVVRIQPEVDWTRVENFGHFHFLLETGHKPDQLGSLLAEHGFELCLGGRAYRDRYIQVEADVWGIGDLMQRVALLDGLPGIRTAGIVWNQRLVVNSDWMSGLLD